jgi:hypothetical protein
VPWDRGYYYRSTRRNGQPRREYVGAGRVAELVSRLDELDREKRQAEAAAQRAEREEVEALDARLDELTDLADLAAEAALLAAGYHRHKRGEWRKRRGQAVEATTETGVAG